MIKLVINGATKIYRGRDTKSLMDYLRDDLALISVKNGCSGQGSCGACTVQINGSAALSCSTPMKKLENAEIVTPDGLLPREKEAFATAFVKKGGIQCGFCTPGIVMRAKALLDKKNSPTSEEIVGALNKHTCRCTGYQKVVSSIEHAAEILRGKEPKKDNSKNGGIGCRVKKYNGLKKVIGQHPFVGDLKVAGMLHAALKFSDHPRAKLLSLNTEKAQTLDGVVRIFDARDILGDKMTGIIIPDWPLMVDLGEETRYVGDVICSVVAKSEEIARKAVELIEVEYEVLQPIITTTKALEANAHKIHPSGNLLSLSEVARGDIHKARETSAFISKGTYTTQTIEHAFLEPECTLAKPWKVNESYGVEVFSQGQGAYEDRKQIAVLLGIDKNLVKVVQVENGGGFGGKEDLTTQGHAALYCYLLKTPVRLCLNRDESMRMHPKRHPFEMDYELGCDKDGMFTFLKANIVSDTGAYASVGMKVVERGVGHASGAYFVPSLDVVGKAVYTNNIPNGAMRGFGVNQATFAMESCIDDLCEKGAFDRWQIRYLNAIDTGKKTATGQTIEAAAGLKKTLLAVKDEFYKADIAGIACGIKNTGIGNGMSDIGRAKIVIENEGRVVIHHGWTEMGQGVHTVAQQTLCEECGIDPKIIEVKVETNEETECGMTTASRATALVGHAIISAAKELKKDLNSNTLKELVGKSYFGEWRFDQSTKPQRDPKKEPITHFSYSYATQLVILNNKGKITKVIAAHDAGKVVNPTLFEGQIEGGVHMGLGYAIRENFIQNNGRPKSTKLSSCQILKANHTPKIEVIAVEEGDPNGPYGAKGVGEIGLVPTAGAVANALYQFDKIRRYSLPLNQKCLIR